MRNPTKGDESELETGSAVVTFQALGWGGTKLRRRETGTSGGWGLRAPPSRNEKSPGTSTPDVVISHGVRPGPSQWRSSHASPSPLRPPEGLDERAFVY